MNTKEKAKIQLKVNGLRKRGIPESYLNELLQTDDYELIDLHLEGLSSMTELELMEYIEAWETLNNLSVKYDIPDSIFLLFGIKYNLIIDGEEEEYEE